MSHTLPQGLGITLPEGACPSDFEGAVRRFSVEMGWPGHLQLKWRHANGAMLLQMRLRGDNWARLCPAFDTLGLAQRLRDLGAPAAPDDLMREAWLALLAAPQRIDFASLASLRSHLRVRCRIARAAEKAALAFNTTDAAERPAQFWRYSEAEGYLLQPEAGLVEALRAATQPEPTGRLYDFSCYRASEYVILLGLAQEAQRTDPALYGRLQDSARETCIKSGQFHEVFLTEYGSLDAPIPERFYVPGDRVWFKNPDEPSSNASGYEGSWVIYLGQGLFSNFWRRKQPYTLERKALELFHWRHGTYRDVTAAEQTRYAEDAARRRATKTAGQ